MTREITPKGRRIEWQRSGDRSCLIILGFARDAILLFKIGTVHWVDLGRFTAVWFGLADSLFMAGFHRPRRTKTIGRAGHGGKFCLQTSVCCEIGRKAGFSWAYWRNR